MKSRAMLAAAIGAALLSPVNRRPDAPAGPAPRKFFTVDRSAPSCLKGCALVPVTLDDGRKIKQIDHAYGCRVGIDLHNQQVDNRQVRRAYARIMAKRGES